MTDLEMQTAEHLLPMIYDRLMNLARKRLARYGTREYLHPAELVHEAYLRVAMRDGTSFEGYQHLFFVISRAMRDLLVESFRRHATVKRGGKCPRVELESVEIAVEPSHRELIDLKRALRRLARESPACARVVLLSCFAGLTHPEVAAALRLSRATVERRLKSACARLQRELAETVR